MDKIKRQFKDFWSYYRLTSYGVNAANAQNSGKFIFPFFVCVFVVIILFAQISSTATVISLNYTTALLCGSALGTGICLSYKTSLLAVAPFSRAQRITFGYLTAILRALIVLFYIFVISVLFVLVVALCVFIASGENLLLIEENISAAPTAYGSAFEALFTLFTFFAFYGISILEKTKTRNIAMIIFVIFMEAFVLTVVNLCASAYQAAQIQPYNQPYNFTWRIDVLTKIDYLAYPWILIIVTALLAVGAFAFSLWMSFKRFQTKNY